MDEKIKQFQEQLDKQYNWPSLYTFKFIVPKDKEPEIKNLFSNHDLTEKKSRNGNYISFTIKLMAQSSDKVIEYYVKAHEVEGVIAL